MKLLLVVSLAIAAVVIAGGWFILTSVSAVTAAVNMQATFYDDGKSCPGGCDSHVVFHKSHNGTRNAYDPASSPMRPKECAVGQNCMICFSASPDSCLEIMYRGSGPPVGKFDFTTTFLKENCDRADLPPPLARECRTLKPRVEQLKRHTNCFENPADARCQTLLAEAERRQTADLPLYDECKSLGENAFNRKYANQREKQRTFGCAYEKFGTGGNPRTGRTWKKLLPGACRPKTFVGRDALDCCSNNLHAAAKLGVECAAFFPR